MNENNPKFQITDQILNLVASVMENIGRVKAFKNLKKTPRLRKQNRIRSIYSSCAIEANSLSIEQVSDIINGKKVIGAKNEIKEIKNAINAYDIIDEINPFNIEDIKKIHAVLTLDLLDTSGEFRKNEEGVFDGDKCIFIAPPANLVPTLMNDLFVWINENKNSIHPLIISSIFHYEFVFIHPFQDGNGRTARLIQSAMLGHFNQVFYWLPIENYIKDNQKEYYDVISLCHKEGEATAFIEFMLKMINQAFINLCDNIDININHISIYIKRIMAVMEVGVPFTAKEIMEKLGIKSKETFRKNYLHPSIEHGLIEYEIKDKPTSRNQRYFRKQ